MPSFQDIARTYLIQLRDIRNSPVSTDELSLRPALDELLKSAAKLSGHGVTFISEGTLLKQGRPDFILTAKDLPIGYVEAEKPEVDLDNMKGATKEQNARFSANLDNFLLTNHLDFRLYSGGQMVLEASLPAPPEKGAPVVPGAKAEKLQLLLETMFKAAPLPIEKPGDLALHLSRRARQLRDSVRASFERGTPSDQLSEAYEGFKKVLLPDLKTYLSDEDRRKPKRPQSFDDLFAQTIAYGLFAARCGHTSGPFTRASATDYLGSNPFLKRVLVQFITDLDPDLCWIVDDMVALLDNASIETIQSYFYKRSGREDPMIDFYEPFLQAYDSTLREVRGVYYTPVPVVSYIVRSLHHILQTRFGRPSGLADENTMILDPATGTGSFLFAVIDEIHAQVAREFGGGAWPKYVEDKLLHRIFGFELLMAPYAVAHLKLGLQLAGQEASIPANQRFGIYLTNTLDDAVKQSDLLMGTYISNEANSAVKIKNTDPILVVLGNPPYSGHSSNPSRNAKGELNRIGQLIENYKTSDPRLEMPTQGKWYQNDYIKFMAFAQERINRTGEGVVGFITANSFLSGPTFPGMRHSLIETFSDIYVFNLHGNIHSIAPDGSTDENVFQIKQGVSIFIAVKESGNDAPAKVHYADLWGSREEKYSQLRGTELSNTDWVEVEPTFPNYYFTPTSNDLKPDYEQGFSVPDMFGVGKPAPGILTTHDQFAISFTADEMEEKVEKLLQSDSEIEARKQFKLCSQKQWSYSDAKRSLSDGEWKNDVTPVFYRPFDIRWTVYNSNVAVHRRERVTRQMLRRNNLALITTRQVKQEDFAHIAVTKEISEVICLSNKTSNNGFLFPLYDYPEGDLNITEREPNFAPLFIKAVAQKLSLPAQGEHGLPQGVTPEDIFHYAYAIFHSPSYRELYGEFLKSDFPRLPLTSDRDLFFDLAALGRELVALHLLDATGAPALASAAHPFEGAGDGIVDSAKVKWSATTGRVSINVTQGFENVSEEVWEFRIGGYQVAEKWLKDRKGRALSFDDMVHYRRVLTALAQTIRLMDEIDERIPNWPIV